MHFLNKEINKQQRPTFGIMYPKNQAVAVYSHMFIKFIHTSNIFECAYQVSRLDVS